MASGREGSITTPASSAGTVVASESDEDWLTCTFFFFLVNLLSFLYVDKKIVSVDSQPIPWLRLSISTRNRYGYVHVTGNHSVELT